MKENKDINDQELTEISNEIKEAIRKKMRKHNMEKIQQTVKNNKFIITKKKIKKEQK